MEGDLQRFELAILNIDYTTFKGNSTKSTPRPRIEYILELDMAKQLCMLARNEKGINLKRVKPLFYC